MPLSSGTRLGAYEIVAPIGKGGMGEVYRARDTKLGREVAIKVLPEELARNEDGLARLEREARLLATLNHPGIATLHGLEEENETRFLVMELVEGETLAERIRKRAIPVDETLSIFTQIAEALEAAHEAGIVHRDLKPANVKITPNGRVKVLDFGLAKALADPPAQRDASHSPTITRDGTVAGTMLGTPAYMSPEQARGQLADRRSDLWSFGCCLYEALGGRSPFLRETVADTIAGILERAPEPLQGMPVLLDRAVMKCLDRNPSLRWQSARDLLDALVWIRDGITPPVESKTERRSFLVPAMLGALLVGMVAAWISRGSRSPRPTIRLEANLPSGFRLGEVGGSLAISSDGERFAYTAQRDNEVFELFVRSLDEEDAQRIEGTEGAWNPFFSPDGQWIGFQAGDALFKSPISGGAPQQICEVGSPIFGAAWLTDETIIFGGGRYEGLFRVSALGGTPEELTRPDREREELGHGLPYPLPDGDQFLFTVETDKDSSIAVLSLRTGEHRLIIEGGAAAQWLPSGHLVFAQYSGLSYSSSLLATPFGSDGHQLEATPAPVVDDVYSWIGSIRFPLPQFAVSSNGVFLYMPADVVSHSYRTTLLSWVERDGTPRPFETDRRGFIGPRFSPDGERLAVTHQQDIWTIDLDRGAYTRLTFDESNFQPVWRPDGSRIVFVHNGNLHWLPVDRSEEPLPILPRGNLQHTGNWSPDGRVFGYHEHHPTTGVDIWTVAPDGGSDPMPVLITEFDEGTPAFSPDGRWMAYVSDESGRFEVYVRSYPDVARKFVVSTEGGREPRFSDDGRELFYRNGRQMLSVTVEDSQEFRASEPRVLFEGDLWIQPGFLNRNYDVAPDGNSFLIVTEGEERPDSRLNVVVNWFDELERLVPTN